MNNLAYNNPAYTEPPIIVQQMGKEADFCHLTGVSNVNGVLLPDDLIDAFRMIGRNPYWYSRGELMAAVMDHHFDRELDDMPDGIHMMHPKSATKPPDSWCARENERRQPADHDLCSLSA